MGVNPLKDTLDSKMPRYLIQIQILKIWPMQQQHHMGHKQFQHNKKLQDQRIFLTFSDLERAHHEAGVHGHLLDSIPDSPGDNSTFFLILLDFQLSGRVYTSSKGLDELHMP